MTVDEIVVTIGYVLVTNSCVVLADDGTLITNYNIDSSIDLILITNDQIGRACQVIEVARQQIIITLLHNVSITLNHIVFALELSIAVSDDGGVGSNQVVTATIDLGVESEHVVFAAVDGEVDSCHVVLLAVDEVGCGVDGGLIDLLGGGSVDGGG